MTASGGSPAGPDVGFVVVGPLVFVVPLVAVEAGADEVALVDFDRALGINPRYGWAYQERGIVHLTRTDFTAAAAVAFDEQGFLYAVDLLKHDVKVFTVHGEFVARFGGWFSPETRGRSPGELLYPTDIAVDPAGPIYVAERYGQRVQVFQREPLPAPQR